MNSIETSSVHAVSDVYIERSSMMENVCQNFNLVTELVLGFPGFFRIPDGYLNKYPDTRFNSKLDYKTVK